MGTGFQTKGYCSRTIGYCFPYSYLEIFVGGQDCDGGDIIVIGRFPSSPTRENPEWHAFYSMDA